MSVLRLLILLLGVYGIGAVAQPPPAEGRTAEEPKGEIGGAVISAQTGQALRSTLVSLRLLTAEMKGEAPQITAVTGLDGRYRFVGLPAGNYELHFSKSGYQPRQNRSLRLSLNADQVVTDLVTKLWRPAVLAGRVVNVAGEPVYGARVEAYRRVYSDSGPYLKIEGSATSNDLGEYRILDLAPGDYIAGVTVKQAEAPPGILSYEYSEAYYPNARSPSEGVRIKLTWGEEAHWVDFQLSPALPTAVAGVAQDAALGGPCADCIVSVAGTGDLNIQAPGRSVRTRKNGTFGIAGLAPGRYRLTASTIGMNPRIGSAEVQVAPRSVSQVAVAAGNGYEVAGTVVWEEPPATSREEQQPKPLQVCLTPEPGTPQAPIRPASVPPNGGPFVLENAPAGKYRFLLVSIPDGGYLKAVDVAGQPLPGPAITLGEGSLSGITIHLASDGATVRGTVRESGKVPRGLVALVPTGADPGYQVKRVVSYEADGNFEITGVAPGRYTLFAVPSRDSFELSDPEVRRALQSFGVSAELDAEETTTIELSLIPASD